MLLNMLEQFPISKNYSSIPKGPGQTLQQYSLYYNLFSTNQLTPLKCITFIHPDPWFTPSAHHVKHIGHQLQCLRIKTGLTVHILAYKDHRTKRHLRKPSLSITPLSMTKETRELLLLSSIATPLFARTLL